MIIQRVNLNGSDIDEMSIKEICDMCLSVCKHILTYLGTIMVQFIPSDKTHLAKYRYLVLRYINYISRIGNGGSTIIEICKDDIQIVGLNCLVANQNVILRPLNVTPSI